MQPTSLLKNCFPRSRKGRLLIAILLPFIILHVYIVFSIILQPRPVIWFLYNDTIHRNGKGADFFALYHAGVNCRNGISPYTNNADGVTPYFYPFRYLPIIARGAQLATLFSPQQAYIVWIIVLEASLILLLIILYKQQKDRKLWLASVLLLIMSSPYFLELYMGQFTFMSTVLFALTFFVLGGPFYFCASALLKPVCLVTVPAFIRDRRCWLGGIGAVACVLFLSVPYFINHYQDLYLLINSNLRPKAGLDSGNYGLVRLLYLLVSGFKISLFAQDQHWANLVAGIRLLVVAATTVIIIFTRNSKAIVSAQ